MKLNSEAYGGINSPFSSISIEQPILYSCLPEDSIVKFGYMLRRCAEAFVELEEAGAPASRFSMLGSVEAH
ncbi:hypothetical protein [Halobacillus sp. K22]|uniref:hypothetical protein n=1 Tax=Halobacillus sp. K22 TaxID=3457431 RepID=UPI003FCC5B31